MDNSGGVLSDLVNSEAHVLEVRRLAVFESLHFGLSASADGAELSVKSLWMHLDARAGIHCNYNEGTGGTSRHQVKKLWQNEWHFKWISWMGKLALFCGALVFAANEEGKKELYVNTVTIFSARS